VDETVRPTSHPLYLDFRCRFHYLDRGTTRGVLDASHRILDWVILYTLRSVGGDETDDGCVSCGFRLAVADRAQDEAGRPSSFEAQGQGRQTLHERPWVLAGKQM
jgi:hypothetical protein